MAKPAKRSRGRPQGSKTRKLHRRFREVEVRRAIKAVRAMGLPISSVTVNPELGTIVVTPGGASADVAGNVNVWDEVLGDAAHKVRTA